MLLGPQEESQIISSPTAYFLQSRLHLLDEEGTPGGKTPSLQWVGMQLRVLLFVIIAQKTEWIDLKTYKSDPSHE